MAFDLDLAARLRTALSDRDDVVERRMFGGLTFMVSGHMCVGVVGEDLCARVGKTAHADALQRPGARPMTFTGRSLGTMVYVSQRGIPDAAALQAWIDICLHFVASLPPK